jgi:hypothetical protein
VRACFGNQIDNQRKAPRQNDMVYNEGDRFYITFNQNVNRAGQSPLHVTRAEIDAVFEFSHPLGLHISFIGSRALCLEIRAL